MDAITPEQWQERALAAEAELARVTRERDLAIAHDRQPYPTAEAYELVCKARTAWQARAEKAEQTLADQAPLGCMGGYGPHDNPEDCSLWYDGCHCTVETLNHNLQRVDDLQTHANKIEEQRTNLKNHVVVLTNALAQLVAAKDEKDTNGETERYQNLKRGAWEDARWALQQCTSWHQAVDWSSRP